eukprot:GDKJ01028808.1.p1 GENE.GDKJ01028808.1~~GDKJ01028808.1.p1  ORF type:complete len:1825 (-),score=350.85 GDKJ01028808.1:541-6015(-)
MEEDPIANYVPEDLDKFLRDIYNYYEKCGYASMLAFHSQRVCTALLTGVFSFLVLVVIDWSSLSKCTPKDCQISYLIHKDLFSRLFSLWGLPITVVCSAAILTLVFLVSAYQDLTSAKFIKRIYSHPSWLGIPNSKALLMMEWPTIAARLSLRQQSRPFHHKCTSLSALDIANIITRRDNMMTMLANSGALEAYAPSWFPRRLLYSEPLIMLMSAVLIGTVLDRPWKVGSNFHSLVISSKWSIRMWGLTLLILTPAVLVLSLAYLLMRDAHAIRGGASNSSSSKASGVAGAGKTVVDAEAARTGGVYVWSKEARLKLRQYCELPHFFESRLERARKEIDPLMKLKWKSALVRAIAKISLFAAGTYLALLVIIGLVEDKALFDISLGGKQLVFHMAATGAVVAFLTSLQVGSGGRDEDDLIDSTSIFSKTIALSQHVLTIPPWVLGRGESCRQQRASTKRAKSKVPVSEFFYVADDRKYADEILDELDEPFWQRSVVRQGLFNDGLSSTFEQPLIRLIMNDLKKGKIGLACRRVSQRISWNVNISLQHEEELLDEREREQRVVQGNFLTSNHLKTDNTNHEESTFHNHHEEGISDGLDDTNFIHNPKHLECGRLPSNNNNNNNSNNINIRHEMIIVSGIVDDHPPPLNTLPKDPLGSISPSSPVVVQGELGVRVDHQADAPLIATGEGRNQNGPVSDTADSSIIEPISEDDFFEAGSSSSTSSSDDDADKFKFAREERVDLDDSQSEEEKVEKYEEEEDDKSDSELANSASEFHRNNSEATSNRENSPLESPSSALRRSSSLPRKQSDQQQIQTEQKLTLPQHTSFANRVGFSPASLTIEHQNPSVLGRQRRISLISSGSPSPLKRSNTDPKAASVVSPSHSLSNQNNPFGYFPRNDFDASVAASSNSLGKFSGRMRRFCFKALTFKGLLLRPISRLLLLVWSLILIFVIATFIVADHAVNSYSDSYSNLGATLQVSFGGSVSVLLSLGLYVGDNPLVWFRRTSHEDIQRMFSEVIDLTESNYFNTMDKLAGSVSVSRTNAERTSIAFSPGCFSEINAFLAMPCDDTRASYFKYEGMSNFQQGLSRALVMWLSKARDMYAQYSTNVPRTAFLSNNEAWFLFKSFMYDIKTAVYHLGHTFIDDAALKVIRDQKSMYAEYMGTKMLKYRHLAFPFIICILNAFVHGINYSLSLTSKDMKGQLKLSQSDVTLAIVFASSIGASLFSPLNSLILKRFGPFYTAASATILGPSGILLVYLVFKGHLPNIFALICLGFFFWGVAVSQSYIVALQAAVSYSKAESRGIMMGLLYGAIGSAGLVISFLFSKLLNYNSASYFLLLLGISLVSFACLTVFVRPLKASEADALAFEVDSEGKATHYNALVASVLPTLVNADEDQLKNRMEVTASLRLCNNDKIARASFRSSMASQRGRISTANSMRGGDMDLDLEAQQNQPAVSSLGDFSSPSAGVNRKRSSSLLILHMESAERRRSSAKVNNASSYTGSNNYKDEDDDLLADLKMSSPDSSGDSRQSSSTSLRHRLLSCARRTDYLLICALQFVLIPLGQTVIANVTSIMESAYRHLSSIDPENLPIDKMSSTCASAVAILSIGNLVGRLIIGVGADFTRNRFNATRSVWIIVAVVCTLVAQVSLGFGYEWLVSGLVGSVTGGKKPDSSPLTVIYFLYGVVVMCGAVYGGFITICATYLSENLPLDIFPIMITIVGVAPVGSTLGGSKYYGWLYDKTAKNFPVDEHGGSTCGSAECFSSCFKVLVAVVCCLALPLSIWLYLVEKKKMRKMEAIFEDEDEDADGDAPIEDDKNAPFLPVDEKKIRT